MGLSLFQLASMVQNNVSGGLRGQQNFTYSLEQLMDEITLERNALLRELELAGKKLLLDACASPPLVLPLTITDFAHIPAGLAELAGLEDQVRRPTLHFTLPRLLPLAMPELAVRYVGAVQRRVPWAVTTTLQDVLYREHRRLPALTPQVFIEGTDAWVLGCRVPQRTISVTAVFENPRLVGDFHDESDYPMPDALARDVVQRLTNKYISQYGRLFVRPNDGTSQV